MQVLLLCLLAGSVVGVELQQATSRVDDSATKPTLHKGLMRAEPPSVPKEDGAAAGNLAEIQATILSDADPKNAEALQTDEKQKLNAEVLELEKEAAADKEDEDEDEDEDDEDDLPNATKTCCGKTTGKQVSLVAQTKDSSTVAKIAAKLSADAKILARDEKNKLRSMKQAAALATPAKAPERKTPCPYGKGTSAKLGCGGRLQTQAKLNSDDRSVALQKMVVKNGIKSLRIATKEMIADRKFVGTGKFKIGKVKKSHKWIATPTKKNIKANNAVLLLAQKLIKDAKKLEDAELAKLTDASGCGNATKALRKAAGKDDKAVDKATVKVDKDINTIARVAASNALSQKR